MFFNHHHHLAVSSFEKNFAFFSRQTNRTTFHFRVGLSSLNRLRRIRRKPNSLLLLLRRLNTFLNLQGNSCLTGSCSCQVVTSVRRVLVLYVVRVLRNNAIVDAAEPNVNARFAHPEFSIAKTAASGDGVEADWRFIAQSNGTRRKTDRRRHVVFRHSDNVGL